MEMPKRLMRKESKEDEQTFAELNRHWQAKCQLAQTSYIKLNCSCSRHIIDILLTELSRSVWENFDLGRVYRPHCVRSVLMTSVEILPYRPPARLVSQELTIYIFNIIPRCPLELTADLQSSLSHRRTKVVLAS